MTELMGRDEIAALLGIAPNSVRDTLRRYGITERRGYPRAAVEALAQPGARPGRGGRINRGDTMTTPTYTITDSSPLVITIHGDFLGQILDRFATQYPQAGPRQVARLIEELRHLDEGVTVDLAGVHALPAHGLPTVTEVLDLIAEHLTNEHYVAGAMAVAAESSR